LLAPAGVTFLIFQYEKSVIKREVKENIIQSLDKSELVLIKLSKAEAKTELDWEHSKEFEYKGEMYDIVQVEKTYDSIKYWCWWDHEETALNKKLTKLVNEILGNDKEKNEQESQLISFYKSLFCEQSFTVNFIQFTSFINHQSDFNCRLVNADHIAETPPPKFFI